MTVENMQFGTLLKHYRAAAALSQGALAAQAGLSQDAISALESGRRGRPRLETARRLCDALGAGGGRPRAVAGRCASRGSRWLRRDVTTTIHPAPWSLSTPSRGVSSSPARDRHAHPAPSAGRPDWAGARGDPRDAVGAADGSANARGTRGRGQDAARPSCGRGSGWRICRWSCVRSPGVAQRPVSGQPGHRHGPGCLGLGGAAAAGGAADRRSAVQAPVTCAG